MADNSINSNDDTAVINKAIIDPASNGADTTSASTDDNDDDKKSKEQIAADEDDKDDEDKDEGDVKEEIIKPFVYYAASMNPDDGSIKIKLLPISKPVPPALLLFISEIGTVENSIHALVAKKTEEKRLMQELFGIAKVGGTSTYFNLASSNLEQMKSEMVISIGNKIKYRYLVYYAKCAASFVFLCALILACLAIFRVKSLGIIDVVDFTNALLMLMGTAIGAWLTFAIQKREVSFQELRVLSDHTTSTKIKLGVILTISLCLFLMFITGFLSIKIGEQFSTDILTRINGRNFAFVLGTMIGLSESKIGITLTSKIETLMAKI